MILTTPRKKVGVIYALFFIYFSLPNEKNTLHIFFCDNMKETANKKQKTNSKKNIRCVFHRRHLSYHNTFSRFVPLPS